ncbi:MAG: insulinase family protein [Bacteroidales bacterium]|nr:insulinase family protein [Bacteroidales bacterium]
MNYLNHQLSNGIKVIHLPVDSKVAYAGLIINAGSRDENENEHGIAHFIEHVIFKGTEKRKAYHIISRLEDVGGDLDAFTTKEKTCINATFLSDYYERTIELFNDIIFHSTFPLKELQKEKEVILDEINSYKDSPSELIFDEYEELVFPNHPLGRNILGTKKTLKSFTKVDIQQFMLNNYHTNQMVFCSVGNISFKKLIKLLEKYFGNIPANLRNDYRNGVPDYEMFTKNIKKKTFQAHCVIGNKAYDVYDNRRLELVLLNNILGGPGMNSKLNLVLREKFGLVYNVESHYSAYQDTGLFTIYFGTDKENLQKSLALIFAELKSLRNNKLGTGKLHLAKKQILGQIAIGADSNANLLFTLGKSYLLYDKVDSLEEVERKIEKLTSEQLLETANIVFNPDELSVLTYL